MRFQQQAEPGRTTYLAFDVDPDLAIALPTLQWQQRGDGGWRKTFVDADAGQVTQAFANLPSLFERMLWMATGRAGIGWQQALADVSDRLDANRVDWWLTGSAALAVRGAPLVPGDLDLVVADADARRVGDLLIDVLMEPVHRSDWGISNWFGRAVLSARVEWIGGVTAVSDRPHPTDFGLAAAASLQVVRWAGRPIRVPPLRLQRAVSERRGLRNRVAMIDALAGVR